MKQYNREKATEQAHTSMLEFVYEKHMEAFRQESRALKQQETLKLRLESLEEGSLRRSVVEDMLAKARVRAVEFAAKADYFEELVEKIKEK